MFLMVVAMVHSDAIPKTIVFMDVNLIDVEPDIVPKSIESMDVKPDNIEVYVGKQFINKQKFVVCENML